MSLPALLILSHVFEIWITFWSVQVLTTKSDLQIHSWEMLVILRISIIEQFDEVSEKCYTLKLRNFRFWNWVIANTNAVIWDYAFWLYLNSQNILSSVFITWLEMKI